MAEVVIVPTVERGGEIVARHIAALVSDRPRVVLGVATGTSPVPVYRALAEHAAAGLDFSQVTVFALDEYVGLRPDHPESYRAVIDREVSRPLGLESASVHVPDGSLAGIADAGMRYEREIDEAGGIDLQLLGIGSDGHIAFNEPGSSFGSLTRVKTLAESTRRDNARFFESPDEVPLHCVTQGLGTILRARHLVLLAFGERKARAVAASVEGPVTASVPGSAIQLHGHVTVVADEPAAALLANREYYRWAQDHKPDWQGL